ncbi:MAG: hypothetical protein V3V15_07415 [Sphingorhabdus sp.]
MKLLSSATAALLLGIASVSMVTAPVATAQDAEVKTKPSKEFSKVYNEAVKSFLADDEAASKAAIPGLKAAVSKDDDGYMLGSLMFSVGKKFKDPVLEIEGLDRMMASPLIPAAKIPLYHYEKGAAYYNDLKDYSLAAASFEKAYEHGLRRGDIEVNLANSYTLSKNYEKSVDWLVIAIDANAAKGGGLRKDLYDQLVANSRRSRKPALINKAYKAVLKRVPSDVYWRDALLLFQRNSNLGVQETADLVRLVRAAGALGYRQQYSEYAEVVDSRRYPAEVAAVLEEGFASGVISKSEVTFSEIYNDAKGRVAGLRGGWDQDEREANASSRGYLAMLTGDALLSFNEYGRAQKMYEAALAKGGIAGNDGVDQTDRAQMHLAMALFGQGDLARAKAEFAKTSSANRKAVSEYWIIFIEHKLNPPAAPAEPAAPVTEAAPES